jgi:hypothetical protein
VTALTGSYARAAIFTIDPALSSLSLYATTFSPALIPGVVAPGGTSTSLSGSLQADVTPTTFQLLSGSTLVADDVNTLLPGLPADMATPMPGSFAFAYPTAAILGVDLQVALRGLTFSIEDGAPRSLGAGVLGAENPNLAIVAGEGHLNAGNPPVSDLTVYSVTSLSSGPGSYTLVGNLMTVTLPFELGVSVGGFFASNSVYSGQIVASGIIPEPSAAVGAVSLLMAGLAFRWRR